MRLLLVEDDPTYVDLLAERLERIPGLQLKVSGSRDSASEAVSNGEFDLIICDLKIPSRDGELDLEIEHGASVIALARSHAAGTPIIILSAFGTIPLAVSSVEEAPRCDLVGDHQDEPCVRYRTKDELGVCLEAVERFASRLKATDDIEIRVSGAGSELSASEARVVKIFARRCDGRIVEVQRIPTGFSPTSTFRVCVRAATGHLRGLAFAKVGGLMLVRDEASRYSLLVLPVLPVGSFCTLQFEVVGGAAATGALFYQLAPDAKSLFAVLSASPAKAPGIVQTLAEHGKRWIDGSPTGNVLVGDLRKRAGGFEPADVVGLIGGLPCNAIEAGRVVARSAVQHGDLHAGNVLIGADDRPVFVDFGTVAELVAGFDPVSLELCLLFHPSGASIRGSWPSPEQAARWRDLDAYLENCPVPDFVRACRAWALNDSPSDSVLASVYAYSMRQLRFPDTDKNLARGLIAGVGEVLT